MRRRLTRGLIVSALLLIAVPVRAQQAAPLPSTPLLLPPPPDALSVTQSNELAAWVTEMRKWERFDKRWHNEAAHDPFGRIIERRRKPDPPSWLAARCGVLAPTSLANVDGSLGAGCRILAGESADLTAATIRASTDARRSDAEKLTKNSFLTRVHIDGLWTTTSTDVRMYGLVGSHISLVDVGRVQFFGPPGILVLTVPDGHGSRQIKTGYTWGMSVRLRDIRLFAPTTNMTLFLTASKVWVTGGTFDRLEPGGFDIAGFSLAPRRNRK